MWQKSSFCNADKPQCVEVENLDTIVVGVRNGNVPDTMVYFSRDEWQKFIDGVKQGEFDLKEENP